MKMMKAKLMKAKLMKAKRTRETIRIKGHEVDSTYERQKEKRKLELI